MAGVIHLGTIPRRVLHTVFAESTYHYHLLTCLAGYPDPSHIVRLANAENPLVMMSHFPHICRGIPAHCLNLPNAHMFIG
jgi:hypothetical protein